MISLSIGLLLSSMPKFETLFFVTSDCPIARRFTPEIKRIMSDYQSVSTFKVVYEDENASLPKMKAHHREFGLACPLILDPSRRLAKQYEVKGVPAVLVRNGQGKALYFGRIDDSYGSDFKWRPAKQKDLRNALGALKNGKPVPVTKTVVIGCALNN
jgi:thiol-disulfide isomerase/thioredoxin